MFPLIKNDLEHKKTTGRIKAIKDLSYKLKAEYYYGASEIKKIFHLDDIGECNAIAGNREGYDFCFVEYCHLEDSYKWKSKLILKMKNENFPDFHLAIQKPTINDLKISLTITTIFLFLAIIVILFAPNDKKFIGFAFLITDIPLWMITISQTIDIWKFNRNKKKYRINNKEFNEKYVILSGTNIYEINELFSEEICSRILMSPLKLDITFKNHCIIYDFLIDELLTFPACEKALNTLILKARLFEN